MLAFILAPFFIVLELFILQRTVKYLKSIQITGKDVIPYIFAVLLFSGIISTLIGFFLKNGHPLKREFTRFGFYWFGFFLYFVVGMVIALAARYIAWIVTKKKTDKMKARTGTLVFVMVFTIIFSTYGILNAHDLKITDYTLDVKKESDISSLQIALISDLHIGYNDGLKEMQDMVTEVNNLNADIVIIAGDIFDNEYEAIEEPEKMTELLASMESKYGTYAVLGNHDVQEKILMGFTFSDGKQKETTNQIDERMLQFLENSKIHLLYDDFICLEDSVVIYGRPDAHRFNFGRTTRLSVEEIADKVDTTKPIIMIDHQPSELEELSAVGVDVDLCGHTHDGQLWPSKYINYFIWDNPYGYLNVNGMHNIVSSGVGLFGINMRTFTRAEICNIQINFEN